METFLNICGQALGGVAILLGFLSFQMSTRRNLLLFQLSITVTFILHYLLIGATVGMAMNGVAFLRNVVYYRRGQVLGKRLVIEPIVFALLLCLLAVWTRDGWYSVFILLGLAINTFAMALPDPQRVRMSILVTSPMVLIYDVFVLSVGGIVFESVAIGSSVIGLVRMHRTGRQDGC